MAVHFLDDMYVFALRQHAIDVTIGAGLCAVIDAPFHLGFIACRRCPSSHRWAAIITASAMGKAFLNM